MGGWVGRGKKEKRELGGWVGGWVQWRGEERRGEKKRNVPRGVDDEDAEDPFGVVVVERLCLSRNELVSARLFFFLPFSSPTHPPTYLRGGPNQRQGISRSKAGQRQPLGVH